MCIFTNGCSNKSFKTMKKILIILLMFSFFSKVLAGSNGTAYDYEFSSIDGNLIKLSQYKGKVVVVVKTVWISIR